MSGASGPPGPGGFPFEAGKCKGRAADDDNSGSSQDIWPLCAYCNQRFHNPGHTGPCSLEYQYLPGTFMDSGNDFPPLDEDMDFYGSGNTDLVTDFLSSGALFSTVNTTESSDAQNWGLRSGESFDRLHDFGESSADASKYTHWQTQDQDLHPEPNGNQPEDIDGVHTGLPLLTTPQGETLEFWRQLCEREHRFPTEREVELIGDLVNLRVDTVVSWFRLHPPLAPMNDLEDMDMQDDQAGTFAAPDQHVISEIKEYATGRAVNDQACENAHSRKASTGRFYRCTVGCGYSTDHLDTWKRHLRTRYPQDFWHCILCRRNGRMPFISHRKDKIFPHLAKVHPSVHRSKYESIRDRSGIAHQGVFPDRCPFANYNGTCSYIPESWDDFVQHCLEHFRERIHDGPWQLRYNRRDSHEDDDNGNGGPNTSTSSGNASTWSSSSGAMSKFTSNDAKQRGTTSRETAGPSRKREAAVPCSLIDVKHCRLVEPPSGAKFLALDYTSAPSECSSVKRLADSRSLVLSTGIFQQKSMPLSFKKAMDLTREMGHQYLWIDTICENDDYEEKREVIYRQASLIIVIVSFDSSEDHIWHFTCDYKNLHVVLNWARKSMPTLALSHIQNLGHGAYGIVDEVCLLSTRQKYARKVCVSRRSGRTMQLKCLEEIEILRKFEHPNIPKFVAAYIQRRSLNILMLPVADCDMRELLLTPHHWRPKLPFLSHWYSSLASALEHMHGLQCRHKDIKPANILISGCDVLLSDFGTSHDFSTSESDSHGPGCMTPKYCAPEVAQRLRRGRKADVFSLGCVFLEMITVELGQTIRSLNEFLGFKSRPKDINAVYNRNMATMRDWLKRLRDHKPSPYQEKVLRITAQMLDEIPSQRPTAQQIDEALSLGQSRSLDKVRRLNGAFRRNVIASMFHSATSRFSKRPKRSSRAKVPSNLTNVPHSRALQEPNTKKGLSLRSRPASEDVSRPSVNTPMHSSQYTALSHTWGAESEGAALSYFDGMFLIRASLEAAECVSQAILICIEITNTVATAQISAHAGLAIRRVSQVSSVTIKLRYAEEKHCQGRKSARKGDQQSRRQSDGNATDGLPDSAIFSLDPTCPRVYQGNEQEDAGERHMALTTWVRIVTALRTQLKNVQANKKLHSREYKKKTSDAPIPGWVQPLWQRAIKTIPNLASGSSSTHCSSILQLCGQTLNQGPSENNESHIISDPSSGIQVRTRPFHRDTKCSGHLDRRRRSRPSDGSQSPKSPLSATKRLSGTASRQSGEVQAMVSDNHGLSPLHMAVLHGKLDQACRWLQDGVIRSSHDVTSLLIDNGKQRTVGCPSSRQGTESHDDVELRVEAKRKDNSKDEERFLPPHCSPNGATVTTDTASESTLFHSSDGVLDGMHVSHKEKTLIEVGDFGLIPLELIQRKLARHSQCTCHHGLLHTEDDYPFPRCCSPGDSEAMIVEATDSDDESMVSPQVLSLSSRGSSLSGFIEGAFLSRPETAETDDNFTKSLILEDVCGVV